MSSYSKTENHEIGIVGDHGTIFNIDNYKKIGVSTPLVHIPYNSYILELLRDDIWHGVIKSK